MQYELIATTAFGLESVVNRELKRLGYEDLKNENGRVIFKGDNEAICRANLWLRSADRILVKIGQFRALSFEELFERTKALSWADWIPKDGCFPVSGKSVRSKLFSVSDCQAIVEKLKQNYRTEWFPGTGPLYPVTVSLVKDEATLTIDTSGTSLHKRGYRKFTAEAPIRETLAAALVQLSRWHPDRPLIDPFCGSGTIPIEAALIGRNIAPGIRRSFAAEQWINLISPQMWALVREEALDSMKKDSDLYILGTDIDKEVLSLARYHAKQAQVDVSIHFQQMPVNEIRSSKEYGYIVCNPPYGERLGEKREAESLYRNMGNVFRNLDTWSYFIFTSHHDFERYFGKRATKKRKLYNGRLECNYFMYLGPKPPWVGTKAREEYHSSGGFLANE
ncbi:MAG: THUMP domain-containing class I SAM-dependent RNA methyltransferase [Clostridia bacterium]